MMGEGETGEEGSLGRLKINSKNKIYNCQRGGKPVKFWRKVVKILVKT